MDEKEKENARGGAGGTAASLKVQGCMCLEAKGSRAIRSGGGGGARRRMRVAVLVHDVERGRQVWCVISFAFFIYKFCHVLKFVELYIFKIDSCCILEFVWCCWLSS